MTIIDEIEKIGEDRGIKIGKDEMELIKNRHFTLFLLRQDVYSVEEIAKIIDTTEEFVLQIRFQLAS